jgi:hypothetical protein
MSSLYNLGTNRIEITISNSSPYCVLIHCCGNVSSDPIPSNGCPYTVDSITSGTCLPNHCLAMDVFAVLLWLHTSDVQASCHNVYILYMPICLRSRLKRECVKSSGTVRLLFLQYATVARKKWKSLCVVDIFYGGMQQQSVWTSLEIWFLEIELSFILLRREFYSVTGNSDIKPSLRENLFHLTEISISRKQKKFYRPVACMLYARLTLSSQIP